VLYFSPKLIGETIQVFLEENGMELSPEQANEYLDNLSGFFLAFADIQPRQPFMADGAFIVDLKSNC
jgi:hypothetical protein